MCYFFKGISSAILLWECDCFELAGDINGISVGTGTNIQDHSLIHVSKTNILGTSMPVAIGSRVTIGPACIFSTYCFIICNEEISQIWMINHVLIRS
jgi:hypothetical protein